MKLTTLIAVTAVSSTASALYIPDSGEKRFPPHWEDGEVHQHDPFYIPRHTYPPRPEVRYSEERHGPRPKPLPKSGITHPEIKTIPSKITPPEQKISRPITPPDLGHPDEQYALDRIGYSRIEHYRPPTSNYKRQAPKPGAVNANEHKEKEIFLEPLGEAGEKYKEHTSNPGAQGHDKVTIYPKNQIKQSGYKFLEGLIGGPRLKIPEVRSHSSAIDQVSKELSKEKDKNDGLLKNVIRSVSKEEPNHPKNSSVVENLTGEKEIPKTTGDKPQEKETSNEKDHPKDKESELLGFVLEQAWERSRPLIHKYINTKVDAKVKELAKEVGGRPKLFPRREIGPKPRKTVSQIEKDLAKDLEEKEEKGDEFPHGFSKDLHGTSRSLYGYTPEHLARLLQIESDEACRERPERCLESEITAEQLQDKAKEEEAKKYAEATLDPDDFRNQRLQMDDDRLWTVPNVEYYTHKWRGNLFRPATERVPLEDPEEDFVDW